MMSASSASGSVFTRSAADGPALLHAHVERPVGAEGEAALGLVELEGGDAEIHHHAVELRRRRAPPAGRACRRSGPRPGAAGRDARAASAGAAGDRVGVAVDARRACSSARRRGSPRHSRRRRRWRRDRWRRRGAQAWPAPRQHDGEVAGHGAPRRGRGAGMGQLEVARAGAWRRAIWAFGALGVPDLEAVALPMKATSSRRGRPRRSASSGSTRRPSASGRSMGGRRSARRRGCRRLGEDDRGADGRRAACVEGGAGQASMQGWLVGGRKTMSEVPSASSTRAEARGHRDAALLVQLARACPGTGSSPPACGAARRERLLVPPSDQRPARPPDPAGSPDHPAPDPLAPPSLLGPHGMTWDNTGKDGTAREMRNLAGNSVLLQRKTL